MDHGYESAMTCWNLEVWKLEVGSWKLEVGSWNQNDHSDIDIQFIHFTRLENGGHGVGTPTTSSVSHYK